MKLLNKFSLLLLSASFAFTACERDYDAPPLSEPEYTGSAANTTIAELRELGASATQDVPFVIAGDFVLKATVTGNDESGNIYKKYTFRMKQVPSRWKLTRTACTIIIRWDRLFM